MKFNLFNNYRILAVFFGALLIQFSVTAHSETLIMKSPSSLFEDVNNRQVKRISIFNSSDSEAELVDPTEEDADYYEQSSCTEECMNACEPINPGDEFWEEDEGGDEVGSNAYCGCLVGCGCGC